MIIHFSITHFYNGNYIHNQILKFDLIASIPQFSLSIFFFPPKDQFFHLFQSHAFLQKSNASPLFRKATILLNKNPDMFFFNTIILASIICMCLTSEGLTIFFSILIFKVSALMPCFFNLMILCSLSLAALSAMKALLGC